MSILPPQRLFRKFDSSNPHDAFTAASETGIAHNEIGLRRLRKAPHGAARRHIMTMTATTKATVNANPPAMMTQTAGRPQFIVQPMPNRSGKNRLGSSGLK